MGRFARIVVFALAAIGGLYVVLMLWVSSGCMAEETARIPSPDDRHVATVGVTRCGKRDLMELVVLLSSRAQPSVSESVFMARRHGIGDDGTDPHVFVTWTANNALEVVYPSYLDVTSTTDNVDTVAVSFKPTDTP